MAEFRNSPNIKNFQCRICRSLYPHHLCRRQKRLFNLFNVSKISECKCNTVWFKYLLYQSISSTIHIFRDNYIITWSEDCLLYTSDAADEEDSVDLGGR